MVFAFSKGLWGIKANGKQTSHGWEGLKHFPPGAQPPRVETQRPNGCAVFLCPEAVGPCVGSGTSRGAFEWTEAQWARKVQVPALPSWLLLRCHRVFRPCGPSVGRARGLLLRPAGGLQDARSSVRRLRGSQGPDGGARPPRTAPQRGHSMAVAPRASFHLENRGKLPQGVGESSPEGRVGKAGGHPHLQ